MNQPVGFRAKVPMMAASLVLSFGLWAYVKMAEPPGSRDADSKINGANTEKYLSRYIFPDDLGTVPILIEGPQDKLTDDPAGLTRILKDNRVYAYVDFNDLRPGNRTYPIHLDYRKDSLFTFTLLQGSISEDVEVRAEHRFPVTIDPTGEIPKGLNVIYDGATAEPATVLVSGPAPAVNQVKRVRALLDLSTIEPHKGNTEVLDPLDENDHSVPGVDITPTAVNILPSVAPAAQSEMVMVEPVWSGHPALGFYVSDYSVEPNQVAVQGAPEVLAKLRSVSTVPIILDGLNSSTSFERALDLPPGVKLFSGHNVRVKVTLRAQNKPSAPQLPTRNDTITVP